MATAQITASQLASEDWQIAEIEAPKPASLVVQQRKRAWAFPWFRLVWAEGDSAQIKIAFTTHLVTVTGHGLTALLAVVADHRVVRLVQPTENDAKFGVRGPKAVTYSGPSITDISVEEFAT